MHWFAHVLETLMYYRPIMIVLMWVGLLSCANAQGPQLELPDFDHLRGKATETVDISLGSFVFFLTRRFMDDTDPQSVAVRDLLKGVQSMRVRHYEFADDFVYSRSDLDRVRSQLKGWNTLARVHDRRNNQQVDICVAVENEKITGLAIVATEPREFTIINVVGKLDVQQVAALREKFAADYDRSLHAERPDKDRRIEPDADLPTQL
jgi:hypothetical protein